jgi:CMP-N,N'-diacetyllegionaminic acid synthase
VRDLGRVVGHIPARGGSKRVPAKNLRYLCGKPMIAYAIECAVKSEALDDVYVNTDSDDIAKLAESLGVKVYRRSGDLASDTATGDDFTADFIGKIEPTTLVMVSPVCPLVEPQDVRRAVAAFRASDCDTLITCQETHMQTFCDGRPVNIDLAGPLAPSQDNPVVQILNWAVTIWDARAFMQSYARNGNGYIGNKRLLLPLPATRGIKVSDEQDFRLAELQMKALRLSDAAPDPVRYWSPRDAAT